MVAFGFMGNSMGRMEELWNLAFADISCRVFIFWRVLRIPVRGRRMRPLDVAGDGAKYFLTRSAFMSGMPSNCRLEIACSKVDMLGLKND